MLVLVALEKGVRDSLAGSHPGGKEMEEGGGREWREQFLGLGIHGVGDQALEYQGYWGSVGGTQGCDCCG